MSDVTIPEATETPLPDMIRGLVQELKAGWRLKAEAPDGLASHSCGRALSAEVGRILASEWPLMRDPRPDETLNDYVNQIPQFAEVVVVGVVARLIDRAQTEERERCAKLIEEGFDRPVGERYADDPAVRSKNDKCPHGRYMYEDCEQCCAQAIRSSHE